MSILSILYYWGHKGYWELNKYTPSKIVKIAQSSKCLLGKHEAELTLQNPPKKARCESHTWKASSGKRETSRSLAVQWETVLQRRAGERAYCVSVFVHKHEDLRSNYCAYIKGEHISNPSTMCGRNRRIPGTRGCQSRLSFSERPCLKGAWRRVINQDFLHSPLVSVYICIW